MTPNAAELKRLCTALGVATGASESRRKGETSTRGSGASGTADTQGPASGAGSSDPAPSDAGPSASAQQASIPTEDDLPTRFARSYLRERSEAPGSAAPDSSAGASLLAVLAKGPADRVRVESSPGHGGDHRDGVDQEEHGRYGGVSSVAVDVHSPFSGLKRVGGQGDVLAGTLATFLGWAWGRIKREQSSASGEASLGSSGGAAVDKALPPAAAAAPAGSLRTDVGTEGEAEGRGASAATCEGSLLAAIHSRQLFSDAVKQELAVLGLQLEGSAPGALPGLRPVGYEMHQLDKAMRQLKGQRVVEPTQKLSLAGRPPQAWELGYTQAGASFSDVGPQPPIVADTAFFGFETAGAGSGAGASPGLSGAAGHDQVSVGRNRGGGAAYACQSLAPSKRVLQDGQGPRTAVDVRNPRAAVACACVGASAVARRASALAYSKVRRAMTAPDVLKCMGEAFVELFPESELAADPAELVGS